jgi:hypothetical protein
MVDDVDLEKLPIRPPERSLTVLPIVTNMEDLGVGNDGFCNEKFLSHS